MIYLIDQGIIHITVQIFDTIQFKYIKLKLISLLERNVYISVSRFLNRV